MLLAVIALVLAYVTLYKTRFGLRLCACGEHPPGGRLRGHQCVQDALCRRAHLGVLGGLGGIVYITAGVSEWKFENGVAGFGFLALAVMIFGQWKPTRIALAALVFGLFGPWATCTPASTSGCPQPAQQRVQHAALYHLPDHPGLHLRRAISEWRPRPRVSPTTRDSADPCHKLIPSGPPPIRAAVRLSFLPKTDPPGGIFERKQGPAPKKQGRGRNLPAKG